MPSVHDILSKEHFDGQDVILLDKNNLQMPNSQGTTGKAYWKTNKVVKGVEKTVFELASSSSSGANINLKAARNLCKQQYNEDDDDICYLDSDSQ